MNREAEAALDDYTNIGGHRKSKIIGVGFGAVVGVGQATMVDIALGEGGAYTQELVAFEQLAMGR